MKHVVTWENIVQRHGGQGVYEETYMRYIIRGKLVYEEIYMRWITLRSILTSYLGKSECTPTRAMPASPSLSCKKTIINKLFSKDSRKLIKRRPKCQLCKRLAWPILPHSWSCCLLCVLGHFRHGDKQTTNQVILVQACSWPVRRQSFAKKKIYAGLPCFLEFLILSHLNANNLILSHLNTWNLLLSHENAKSVILCENLTRHLPLQMLRLENRGRQLTICIMSLPPRKPNLKYQIPKKY